MRPCSLTVIVMIGHLTCNVHLLLHSLHSATYIGSGVSVHACSKVVLDDSIIDQLSCFFHVYGQPAPPAGSMNGQARLSKCNELDQLTICTLNMPASSLLMVWFLDLDLVLNMMEALTRIYRQQHAPIAVPAAKARAGVVSNDNDCRPAAVLHLSR